MRLATRAAFALLITLVGVPAALAQVTPGHPRVEQALELARVWLEAQRAYEQIPGLSAAIVHDQQVLWQGGYGFADLAAKRPAAPDTIYSICSISKLNCSNTGVLA